MSEITPINASLPITGLHKVERDQRERPPRSPKPAPKSPHQTANHDEPPPHVDEIV